VAIFLGKLVSGGLGFNPFSSARRASSCDPFPVQMTT
jgi:hypothetical protein